MHIAIRNLGIASGLGLFTFFFFFFLNPLSTGKCAAQKLKKLLQFNFMSMYVYIVAILRSQNKITDFLMILTWLCRFNYIQYKRFNLRYCCKLYYTLSFLSINTTISYSNGHYFAKI